MPRILSLVTTGIHRTGGQYAAYIHFTIQCLDAKYNAITKRNTILIACKLSGSTRRRPDSVAYRNIVRITP